MGAVLVKCLQGKTDLDQDGVPDSEQIKKIIETYFEKKKTKKQSKVLKKILKS